MEALLERLFREAEADRPGHAGQAPALECFVMLVTASGLEGVLSTTPEGTLKMLSHSKDEENRPILIEHFFPYETVVSVSLRRAVTPVPRIHTA